MKRVAGQTLAVVTLVLLCWIAIGGAMTALAGPFKPRGEFFDIGGRRMRIVCEGPATATPTVLMESGAFGLAADFGAVQESLAAKGIRSCAYDRAGLGWSDPGPAPRDSLAIVADLEALLAAKGETGPFIVMGHSMAGLHVRLFAARNAPRIAGLVLVEATTPEAMAGVGTQRFVRAFVSLSNTGAVLASVGAMKPFIARADRIGLPPLAAAEKRRAFASGRHNRTAAAEVRNWARSAHEAGAAAPYDPAWPVAVIVAGDRGETIDGARGAPAKAARHGSFEVVREAGHASVLGMAMNGAVVRGVEFVLANAKTAKP
jgi:pimeloyl-ACP methyl ester carboxylesterase